MHKLNCILLFYADYQVLNNPGMFLINIWNRVLVQCPYGTEEEGKYDEKLLQ